MIALLILRITQLMGHYSNCWLEGFIQLCDQIWRISGISYKAGGYAGGRFMLSGVTDQLFSLPLVHRKQNYGSSYYLKIDQETDRIVTLL